MFTFRNATFSDAKEISKLVNSAYRGESSKKGWTTEESLLDGMRTNTNELKSMIRHEDIVVALNEHNEIVGCVYLEKRKESLYLGMLTVKPTLQAQGLGKILLGQAELYAYANQLSKIIITVIDSRHELIAFYERRGFKFTGRTIPFPVDPVFGISKVGDIKFKEFEKIL